MTSLTVVTVELEADAGSCTVTKSRLECTQVSYIDS